MREQLQPVHQSRAGPGEVSGRVDGHDRARAERGEPLRVGVGLVRRPRCVVAAGHHHHGLGLGRLDLLPRGGPRPLAREAERVLTARKLDHLRDPVTSDVRRVEPLERDRARAGCVLDGLADAVDAGGGLVHQLRALLGHTGGRREIACAGKHLSEGRGVERQDLRHRVELFGDGADVVRRHRADLAERLGHDQVGLDLVEDRVVELVDRLAAARALAHLAVDLGRTEALRYRGASEAGQLGRLWRIIAFVSDRDHVVPKSEGEQRLGRRGDKACDAHGGHDGTSER